MRKILLKGILVFSFLILSSCGTYFNQPFTVQEARLGETTDVTQRLKDFALPNEPVVVGVYKFRDQTGQYKPTENGSSFSTAVTQGGTTILIKALEDSKWFEVIERENIANLLNERNIIRKTRTEYRKNVNPDEPQLPPLLYAGVILEGGIISYDSNIVTGGLGARYFGIGGSTQYRQDRITVYLRAVSTSSGKILKTVYISKTILSQAIDASLFKYVKFKRLLEAETGFTKNEPVQLAVTEAIEKAVESLIIEGIQDKLWSPKASQEDTAELLEAYDLEQEEAISTEIYDRFLTERRGKNVIHAAVGGALIDGDYANPKLELNARIGYKHYLSPYININFLYNKYNLANKDILNEGFMSFDLNAEYNILPFDKLTPYVYAGVGTNASNYFNRIDAKMQFGLGLEYLVTNNFGVTLYGEHNTAFTDELDGIVAGKLDDMFYRFGLGVNLYFTQPKTKFNEKRFEDAQELKEQNAQAKLNKKIQRANEKEQKRGQEKLEKNTQQTDEKAQKKAQAKLNKKAQRANKKKQKEAAGQKIENEKTIINANKIEDDGNKN